MPRSFDTELTVIRLYVGGITNMKDVLNKVPKTSVFNRINECLIIIRQINMGNCNKHIKN